jgi:protein TonB
LLIEKDGSITDARVTRSVDPALDKEALRVINSMPKWIPGKKNGRNVRVRFNAPVQFKLQ